MRCHEARQKIDGFDRTQFDSNRDKELLEHLQSCSKCAEMAEIAKLLNRDLEAGGASDSEGGLSFPNLKSRVEETVDARQNQLNKDSNIMSKLINSVTKRPRLGLSLGVIVILLAFVTLVPFKFERTIGYEVAIAGVDRDLALDSDKVQTLFIKLGLDDAKFDVSNCEATCNMKITHLRSEDDAKIIVAAFDELGNCKFEEVKRIQGEHSTPLLWYRSGGNVSLVSESEDDTDGPIEVTMDATLFLDKVDGKTKIYVSDVVGKLSSESTGEFNIWVSKGDADGEEIIVVDPTDSHSVIYIDSLAMSGNNSDEQVWGIGEDDFKTTVRFLTNESGESKFIVKTPDGNINIFDYDEDNVVEKLNKLGVDVQLLGEIDGTGSKTFFIGDGITYSDELNEVKEVSISPSATKFSSNLPESYKLHQNYPNPFNPSTTILYSLPKSEHVVLEIYNTNGQKVRTLLDEVVSAGDHSIIWDATNDNNIKVATGIYLYKINAGDFVDSKKMSLVK